MQSKRSLAPFHAKVVLVEARRSHRHRNISAERDRYAICMQPVEIGEAEIEPESCSSPTMALMVASEEIVEVDDDAKKKVRETGRM